jgi:hypothetical protein
VPTVDLAGVNAALIYVCATAEPSGGHSDGDFDLLQQVQPQGTVIFY